MYKTIILFLSFSIFLLYKTGHNSISPINTKKPPQEYMKNFTATKLNASGNHDHILTASSWKYVNEQGASLLVKPYFTVYRQDGSIWHVKAQQATAVHPTLGSPIQEIQLNHNVVLHRPKSANNTSIVVSSNAATYFPKREYVETDQFVTMSQPGLKITGTGCKAYLAKGLVEILNDVTTFYDPATRKIN